MDASANRRILASPQPALMAEWAEIRDAYEWAGFAEDPDSVAALMLTLGYDSSSPLDELGTIEKTDYEDVLRGWMINGERPKPAIINKAKRLGHAARVFAGTELSASDAWAKEEAESNHRREVEWYKAQPAQTTTVMQTPTATPVQPSTNRKASMDEVCDTARKDQVEVLSTATIDALRKHYQTKMCTKRGPAPEIEPTAEQLSVPKAYKDAIEGPYTDFSIWGPFHGRTRKKMRTAGYFFGLDGLLTRQEYSGPPSYEHWLACFEVFERV